MGLGRGGMVNCVEMADRKEWREEWIRCSEEGRRRRILGRERRDSWNKRVERESLVDSVELRVLSWDYWVERVELI
jgi:hypothetical protein